MNGFDPACGLDTRRDLQEQLAYTLFPLGETHKTQIREIATLQGFQNAKKHDSQDLCFVLNGRYAEFIEEYEPACCGCFVSKGSDFPL